jgi:hypothetical protein
MWGANEASRPHGLDVGVLGCVRRSHSLVAVPPTVVFECALLRDGVVVLCSVS